SEISFILVEDGRVFVRCDQLAFRLDEQLPPYLYRVPREYGIFEHLFKRLGAMEEASPVQFAKLLSRLRESCQEETMHANELQVAKHAVFGLFVSLKARKDRNGDDRRDNPLDKIETLYLPSRDQKLQRSTNLVLFDCIKYQSRIPHSMYEFLDTLKKYNLTFATPRQIVELLPVHLQVQSLASLVREELHPECRDKKCRADTEKKCQNANDLRRILFSPELVDGILRILKFQFQKAKLTEDVRNNVRSFQKELSISCMEELSTELVENGTNTRISESRRSKHMDCFVEQEANGRKHIFIKHGVDPNEVRRVLCKEINQLTGCQIDNESWLHLQAILECKSPDRISSVLDNASVSQDAEAGDTPHLEPDLGSEVPEELHELLLQYDDFYFRPGEFVAFEREDSTDDEPKYIYAQIIRKLNTPNLAKSKKDKTKRKQRGESNLLSRYLIDIGSEKIEVDVLDLYKIKRPRPIHEEEDKEMEEESVSDTMELVPYAGSSGQNTGEARAQSSTSSQGANEPPKPRTLENALKEVRKALAEIRKLPEDKQKKAIRRLFLRWHPDKNMDMQEIANEVMKFIQNEVEKFSKGGSGGRDEGFARAQPDFSDFFRQWYQRGRRQRSSYENFRRNNPRFTGFTSHSRRRYTGPDARLSKMWMRQSKEDLRSVEHLLAARDPLYYLVCFQCHQVAEKALKAALYAFSGIVDRQLNTHDLVQLAYDLSLLRGAPDVTTLVARLSDYYDTTRYPDKQVPPKVPADVFQDSQQAQEAFRLAKAVLAAIEPFVGV
ncbi:sacsin-like, partial [Orbicella faveolata]|uniref:sacsin-like n=1 Tax=Orbicella faveolata TaxID=48498 RepID=UPI0009E4DAEF